MEALRALHVAAAHEADKRWEEFTPVTGAGVTPVLEILVLKQVVCCASANISAGTFLGRGQKG